MKSQARTVYLGIIAIIMTGMGIYLVITGAVGARIIAAFAGAIAVLALPIIERRLEVRFPMWLEVWFSLFILGALMFGTILGMYEVIPHWDTMLHLLSGVLVGGFGLVLLHQRLGKLKVVLPVWGRIVLIGMFSATVAVVWEVAEFFSDSFFGTFSQLGDLTDTMLDMINGTVTGTLTAALYYLGEKIAKSKKRRGKI